MRSLKILGASMGVALLVGLSAAATFGPRVPATSWIKVDGGSCPDGSPCMYYPGNDAGAPVMKLAGGAEFVMPNSASGGGSGMSIGGSVTSGTAGSMLFVGTGPVLSQNNSRIFWDNTAFSLRLGTNGLPGGVNDTTLFAYNDTNANGQALYARNAVGMASSTVANRIGDTDTANSHIVLQVNGDDDADAGGPYPAVFQFNTTTPKMRVGINVTTPLAALHVRDSATVPAGETGGTSVVGLFSSGSSTSVGVVTNVKAAGSGGDADYFGFEVDGTYVGSIHYDVPNARIGIDLNQGHGAEAVIITTQSMGIGAIVPTTTLDLNSSGNTAAITMRNGVSTAVSASSTGRLIYNATAQHFQISENGGSYAQLMTNALSLSIVDAVNQTGAVIASGNNATAGMKYMFTYPGTCTVTAIRHVTATATSLTYTFAIWDRAGTKVFGDDTQVIAATGIQTHTLSTPFTASAYKAYTFSVYYSSGATNTIAKLTNTDAQTYGTDTGWFANGTTNNGFPIGPHIYYHGSSFSAGGNAFPSGAGTAEIYPIEPVFTCP